MDSLRQEIDRIYDRVTTPSLAAQWPTRFLDSMRSHPAINMLEDNDNLYIEAELPGVSQSDLEINASDHSVTVSGTRNLDMPEDGTSIRRERSTIQFERTVRMPVHIEVDHVDARLTDGVLTIKLPKVRPARTRRIDVLEA
jgi:HSP20 family protein